MKNIRYITIAIILLLCAVVVFINIFPSEKNLLRKTIEATKKGRFKESRELSTNLILTNPGVGRYYYFRAYNSFQLGDYANAVKDLDRAISKKRDNIFLFLRAESYVHLKKFKEALKDYNELIKNNPSRPEYFLSRGIMRARQGDYSKAFRDFSIAWKLKPERDRYYYDYACICVMAGKTGEALNSLKKAINNGFRDYKVLEKDPDLDPLRGKQEFRQLIESTK